MTKTLEIARAHYNATEVTASSHSSPSAVTAEFAKERFGRRFVD